MIETLSALLTPTIAILGLYIAFQQWRTNHLTLKNDLFVRRYETYEKIHEFIAKIMISGKVPGNSDVEFLRDTKAAFFLFDDQIEEFTKEIYKKAVELHALDAEFPPLRGEDRSSNIKKQREIKEWFQSELRNMKIRFAKYLVLK